MICRRILTRKGTESKAFNMVGLALLFGVLSATPARAQIKDVVVQVKGLACPFCVRGIEKHLKKVDGITSVKTDLKKGESRISLAPSAPLDVDKIKDAVTTGGFTAGEVRATVIGTLREKDGNITVQVSDSDVVFLLLESKTLQAKLHTNGQKTFLSKDTLVDLRKLIAAKRRVQITGTVHSHKDFPAGLSLEKWASLSDE